MPSTATTPHAIAEDAVEQVHIIVTGKVQGVFFRKHTEQVGVRLGLQGWVRNLENGTVEILAQGRRSALTELVRWAHRGSPKAKVTGVTAQHSSTVDNSLTPFSVQR